MYTQRKPIKLEKKPNCRYQNAQEISTCSHTHIGHGGHYLPAS